MLWLHCAPHHSPEHVWMWGVKTSNSMHAHNSNNCNITSKHYMATVNYGPAWKSVLSQLLELDKEMGLNHKSGQWSAHLSSIYLLCQEGYGVAFHASISGNKIHFIGYSFADNMDLIQMGPIIKLSDMEILPLMQAALNSWKQGLCATGGAFVPGVYFRSRLSRIGNLLLWSLNKSKLMVNYSRLKAILEAKILSGFLWIMVKIH